MPHLLLTSLIWAFSFGLVKRYLAGIDAGFVAFARLALALLLFLPLWRPRRAGLQAALPLALVGTVEFGLMYVFYIHSFRFLPAHQVALFTVFTPLYVTLIADLLERRLRALRLGTALLAAAGTAVILYAGRASGAPAVGFLLVQASNACFAAGQVWYRRLAAGAPWRDRDVFAWLYLGGAVAAALSMAAAPGPLPRLAGAPAVVLLYLGLLATGVGFYLWNIGASRVSSGVLAVMNNLKVPLAVVVALVFFGEEANLLRLAIGGAAIALALYLNASNGTGSA